jgi:hypothetical protein
MSTPIIKLFDIEVVENTLQVSTLAALIPFLEYEYIFIVGQWLISETEPIALQASIKNSGIVEGAFAGIILLPILKLYDDKP